jgi:hypothetical protein
MARVEPASEVQRGTLPCMPSHSVSVLVFRTCPPRLCGFGACNTFRISILSSTSEALLRYHPNLINLGEVYCREPIVGTSPSVNNNFLHPTNLAHARESFSSSTLQSLSSVSSPQCAGRSIAVCVSEIPGQDHMRSEYEANDACLRQLTEKREDLTNGDGESDDGESDDGEGDDGESDDDILVAEADKLAATSRRIQLHEQPTIAIKDSWGTF